MLLNEVGSGPPLVIIPGIQGRWEYMRPALEALSRFFRVITFPLADEPSSMAAFDVTRGFGNYVMQVRDALDQSGVSQALICGVSFGGLVALRFAAEFPDRTAGLVLVSTPGPMWHLRRRHAIYARLPYLFGPLFIAETPWRLRLEMAAAFPTRSARWRFAASQLSALTRAPLSVARMARRARMIETTTAVAACARVTAATLIVTGEPELDHVVSATGSTGYLSLIRGASVAVLERTGHLGAVTRPEEFVTIVRRFVDQRCRRPDHTEVA
jgi:3-oxoadipate enol-lactonase